MTHSRLLLQQILRGWGLEAAIALAPEALWWQALSAVFDAPSIPDLDSSNFAPQCAWANTLTFVRLDQLGELLGLIGGDPLCLGCD